MTRRIGIIGVGSIGSVLARGFARLGHDVLINDLDDQAVDALPYASRSKTELGDKCDQIVIAVPTPTTSDGGDFSAVDDALDQLGSTDATIVLRSTMPPGSTQYLRHKHELPLVYSPEFLRDRSDVEDFFTPDRIVLAGPPDERRAAKTVLEDPMIECDTFIEARDYLTAELGKYAHNAFFATKVSFANQMRLICEEAGADVGAVMDIVVADHRNTSSHLDPHLGPFGGKCLPKDLAALTHYANTHDIPVAQLQATAYINDIAVEEFEELDIEGSWPNVSAVPQS